MVNNLFKLLNPQAQSAAPKEAKQKIPVDRAAELYAMLVRGSKKKTLGIQARGNTFDNRTQVTSTHHYKSQ